MSAYNPAAVYSQQADGGLLSGFNCRHVCKQDAFCLLLFNNTMIIY